LPGLVWGGGEEGGRRRAGPALDPARLPLSLSRYLAHQHSSGSVEFLEAVGHVKGESGNPLREICDLSVEKKCTVPSL